MLSANTFAQCSCNKQTKQYRCLQSNNLERNVKYIFWVKKIEQGRQIDVSVQKKSPRGDPKGKARGWEYILEGWVRYGKDSTAILFTKKTTLFRKTIFSLRKLIILQALCLKIFIFYFRNKIPKYIIIFLHGYWISLNSLFFPSKIIISFFEFLCLFD